MKHEMSNTSEGQVAAYWLYMDGGDRRVAKGGIWRRRKARRAAARPLPASSPVRGGEGGATARFIHIISKMSWQHYVDQQLMGSGVVSKAVIAGHDGTLWAKSNNIEVSINEGLAHFAGCVCLYVCLCWSVYPVCMRVDLCVLISWCV